jgi:hypothetical protein
MRARGLVSLWAAGAIAIAVGYGLLAVRIVWLTQERNLARAELDVERQKVAAWVEAGKSWQQQLDGQRASIAKIAAEAARRSALAREALEATHTRATQSEARERELLAAQRAFPGDACASACALLRSPL